MAKSYYFISDLHIGGDEALGVCDFETELIDTLDSLAGRREDSELLIVGDAFGLWEFTQVEGVEKFKTLVGQFPQLFEAFQRVGELVKITVLPGNHDYDLACYPEYVEILKAYNLNLEQKPVAMRELGGKNIWIEHGNQHDAANYMPDFGNPYALPIGYFITSSMVGAAGRYSKHGRYNWLKDIQSVYPTELIPDWVLSNYFYKEMNPLLRWLLLPFLLLSGLSLFVLGGAALEYSGVLDKNIFLNNRILDALGIVGSLFQLILIINAVVLLMLLLLSVPAYLIYRDVKRTLKRFRIELDPSEITGEKEEAYLRAARHAFADDPSTIAFVYGHTHAPSIQHLEGRAIINTGTWLKQFERVSSRFGLLPAIYVPSFSLNYFRMSEQEGHIVVEYLTIDKATATALTLAQRLLVSKGRKTNLTRIAPRTVLKM